MFSVLLGNQKGGVGKTTNAVNLAGALADRGRDVLVVDFDPQGYLTITLGFEREYRRGVETLPETLRDPAGADPTELIREHPEFDLVPASESLRTVNRDLVRTDADGYGMIERFLQTVAGDRYDVVVVDSPPARNAFTDVLLVDCRDVFVPMEPSETSVYSISSFVDRIVELEAETGAGVRIRAVLLSNVAYPLDNEQRRVSEWVDQNFGDRCPVYEIRHRAAIQRSLKNHCTVFGDGAEPTDMREVYADVATQIERLHPDLRPESVDG
ncbi:MAG: ParA family protein [Salinirussus sp.]